MPGMGRSDMEPTDVVDMEDLYHANEDFIMQRWLNEHCKSKQW